MTYQELMNAEIVIARINPPSVFNFYKTKKDAEADLTRANSNEFSIWNNQGPYSVMTYDEYSAGERGIRLSEPEAEITEEKFRYYLEVLPPLKWTSTESFESFLMSEFTSGSYTQQTVRRGFGENARYFAKIVDACDKSTWMTL
jgi:hypothetical protein